MTANRPDYQRAAKGGSLKSRVLNAGAWSLGAYGLGVILRFAVNLIMSRLLVPDMFGLVSVAMVVLVALNLFSDVGLGPNIIRNQEGAQPDFLNTAWSIQILRGAIIWAIALLISLALGLAQEIDWVPKGSAYADGQLPYVIAAISFSALIGGFNSTKLYEGFRDLHFGKLTRIEISAQVAGLACTLAWVTFDRSVWALIAGVTCTNLAILIQSHLRLPGNNNRLRWDQESVREVLLFGKWIFASSILGFLAGNSDRLLLGALINAATLGIYSIAFNIFSVFEQVSNRVITHVAFPALSEIVRERPSELKRHYYRGHDLIALISYFCAGALFTSSQSLIEWLYDPRYAQAGWMLQILALMLLATPSQLAIQSFLALGQPQLHSVVLTVRLVTVLLSIPSGFKLLGLPGALLGSALSSLAALPVVVIYRVRFGLFDLRREMLTVPAIFLGLLVGMLVTLTIGYLPKF